MKKRFLLMMGAVVSIISLFLPLMAGAVYTDGFVSVGIGLDISKNGTDWYNYTADENPGGQTLVVSPGDTVTLRGKSWNAGEANALVSYKATITNSQYFTAPPEVFGVGFGDDDNNGVGFDSSNFQTDANGTSTFDVSLVPGVLSTSKNSGDPEIGSIQATIRSDTPDQTVILATFDLETAGQFIAYNPFIPQAHAAGLTDATTRILVSNPSVNTGGTPTVLPRTGTDGSAPLLPYITILMAGVLLGTSAFMVRKIAKSQSKK